MDEQQIRNIVREEMERKEAAKKATPFVDGEAFRARMVDLYQQMPPSNAKTRVDLINRVIAACQ